MSIQVYKDDPAMVQSHFSKIFAELPLPVIVCDNRGELPVVYYNVRAGLIFFPAGSTEERKGRDIQMPLSKVLHFTTEAEYDIFCRTLRHARRLDSRPMTAVTFEGDEVPVVVYGNSITYQESDDHFVLYLGGPELGREVDDSLESRLNEVLNASTQVEDVNDAIQTVLALTGGQMDVSRTYIFEEISPTTTRNTYEWCAPGVEPAIQGLQNLDKADYPYDVIVNSGMFITDDVSTLPRSDAEVLQAQGIRSLAIIPIFDYNGPLGYVGYDDCEKCRVWSGEEIQFLKSVSILLGTLIKRRKSEQSVRQSLNVLQIITDNLDDIIYANDLENYTLLFVSQSLADSLGKTKEELLGQPCYEMFVENQHSPCEYCPIPKIQHEAGSDRSETYVWENNNLRTGKTYIAKDNIVRWVDGRLVHVETATDISTRKEQELKLRYYASTDVMTNVANREWGAGKLEKKYASDDAQGSLCFIDVDGLKKANDQYGHSAGDKLLIDVVEGIKKHLQPGEMMCRWGGDEFLVWMDVDEKAANERFRLIQREMEEDNEKENRTVPAVFSYGIVAFTPRPGVSLDDLISKADKRMYKNKMEKRGVVFNRRRDDRVDPKEEA